MLFCVIRSQFHQFLGLRDNGFDLPRVASHMFMFISSVYPSFAAIHLSNTADSSLHSGQVLIITSLDHDDQPKEWEFVSLDNVEALKMWSGARFDAAVDLVRRSNGTARLVSFELCYADACVHMLFVELGEGARGSLRLGAVMTKIQYVDVFE